MNYRDQFTSHHVAALVDWLDESGQLFVQVELPHSGGSGLHPSVRSLGELKRAVEQINHPEIEIVIWKNRTQAEAESDNPLPDDLEWIHGHADEVNCDAKMVVPA